MSCVGFLVLRPERYAANPLADSTEVAQVQKLLLDQAGSCGCHCFGGRYIQQCPSPPGRLSSWHYLVASSGSMQKRKLRWLSRQHVSHSYAVGNELRSCEDSSDKEVLLKLLKVPTKPK